MSELGLDKGYVFQVSNSDAVLVWLYQDSRAFIFLSHYEGFGIPYLGTISFDYPVACGSASSIPKYGE